MDGNKIDLISLISVLVLLFAVFKLRSVLGRRTSDDEDRIDRIRAAQRQQDAAAASRGSEAVINAPRREAARTEAGAATATSVAEAEEKIRSFAGADQSVANGLIEILKLDSAFQPEPFLSGARQAYEMIVTAFAEGNRKTLKDLLSREVYEGFTAAIADREARGEVIDQSFVGISKADIVEAGVKNGVAVITIRFLSQLISATRDKAGGIVSGDPQRITEVTDVWTFSRDVSTARARQNLNWRLIATQAAA
jgi:predicted lipid-binding transport protein (Tim44 family)